MGKAADRMTWLEFTTEMCRTNGFPPGFHFALVDNNGRVRRNDAFIFLKDGDPASYYMSENDIAFMMWSLKQDSITFDENEYELVLKNHKGVTLSGRLTLRRVRDMDGLSVPQLEKLRSDREGLIDELSCDVTAALADLSEDLFGMHLEYSDCFVKAVVSYLFDNHSFDAVEHAISLYKETHAARLPPSVV